METDKLLSKKTFMESNTPTKGDEHSLLVQAQLEAGAFAIKKLTQSGPSTIHQTTIEAVLKTAARSKSIRLLLKV